MPDKIKVLTFVSSLAIGGPAGGAERFAADLTLNLDRSHFQPMVCSLWRYDLPPEVLWAQRLQAAGVEVFFAADWGGRRKPWRLATATRNVMRHYGSVPPDIVHTHLPLASLVALLVWPGLRRPALIRTAHVAPEWGLGVLAWLLRSSFTKWIFPLTFSVEACVAPALVEGYDRRPGARLARKRALWLPNAIDGERFSKAKADRSHRSEFGLSEQDLVVGSLGRLCEQKGFMYLVEAAHYVKAELPQARFLVVGDGSLRGELAHMARALDVEDTVQFAGTRSDAEELYGLFDLFVLPSLWEGLPTVVLESMAAGVAVIATNIPGTCELIESGRNGWLVPPAQAQILARAILSALCDPAQRAAMAAAARRDVVPRFSIATVAEQYAQVYTRLAATRHTGKRAGYA
jgi:glycosyltransferase involved in cell wall biosynthesis